MQRLAAYTLALALLLGASLAARADDPPSTNPAAHAGAQGESAAASLLAGPAGNPPRFRAVPYVWSDQFGNRIEILGQLEAGDSAEEIWSVPGSISSLYLYRRDGQPTALVGVNAVRWLLDARRRLRGESALTDEVLEHLTQRIEEAS